MQPSSKPETAQPSTGLYFTGKPPAKRPMLVRLENDRALHIPPGDRNFHVSDDFLLPLDGDALAVYPRAHYLRNLLEAFATLPDGSRRWLIRIPQWEVNWRAVYRYRTPMFLPRGTVVSMSTAATIPQATRAIRILPRSECWAVTSLPTRGDTPGCNSCFGARGEQRPILQGALMRHHRARYPDDVSAYLNLGTLLLSRKQSGEAIAYLRGGLASGARSGACVEQLRRRCNRKAESRKL